MIVIHIPVKIYVKKYLVRRYGLVHQVTKKTFIGLFLLQFLEKKIEKQDRETENLHKYEIQVSEYYFNKKGYTIDKQKLEFLGICMEKLFFEDLFNFIDNELMLGEKNAYRAIRLFFSIYHISENDLKLESMYRKYQRYCNENITLKKQSRAVV